MRFSVQVAEYLSGRNLNMIFSTFILWYVESKFTLLTYLMENNRVINRASDRVRQKMGNSAHFQGKLCDKKGLLCGKLCDFFKADLTFSF